MKMNKLKKNFVFFLTLAVLFAAYLNIGWALGTYYHNYIIGHEPQTAWQTFWAGGWGFWSSAIPDDLLFTQVVYMLFWPLWLAITLVVWLAYFVVWFLWFVFAGGIAKLLGLG